MRLSHDAHIAVLQSPDPVMLISVAAIRGSTPREAGAFMLVSENAIAGTIGGGNLEHQVTLRARQTLASQGDIITELVPFPLGPGLGQCCGGAVDIAFHRLNPMQKHQLATAISSTQNRAGIGHGDWVLLPMGESRHLETASAADAEALDHLFTGVRGGLSGAGEERKLCLRLDDGATPLWLFGAGHVGQAIVQALAPLPFDLHLIDSRDEYLTLPETAKLHLHQSDRPQDEVGDMPSGAFALILTHSHAQDFDICRAALMQDDLGFVGMIGSQTKRARFVRRLKYRGLGDAEIGRLTCPIGIQGIACKQPAIIAASVAVQLLSVREARMAQNLVNRVAQDGLAG
jgi:xanthine dehydrogenase accessory factor